MSSGVSSGAGTVSKRQEKRRGEGCGGEELGLGCGVGAERAGVHVGADGRYDLGERTVAELDDGVELADLAGVADAAVDGVGAVPKATLSSTLTKHL